MEKAIVPKQVAQALDLHKLVWDKASSKTQALQFMALPFSEVKGTAVETLRKYAIKEPETYMQAVLYGYEPRIENEKDLANVIEIWMAKPYVDDERKDIEQFAGVITKHFQH
ncbi:hypothetical protein [Terribacillus sp. DMT04]|uniref:hypothetical protein n=1 Tax=Terribacillus sp. DMT04 TaxID=2850441 RepID=UPI001C2C64AA|nr:hypothetical protein [Terribacillus sp. DMT04]QXE02801.1 hypothetical protein KS242_06370 [Terribacillus sp. DMT04]